MLPMNGLMARRIASINNMAIEDSFLGLCPKPRSILRKMKGSEAGEGQLGGVFYFFHHEAG